MSIFTSFVSPSTKPVLSAVEGLRTGYQDDRWDMLHRTIRTETDIRLSPALQYYAGQVGEIPF